MLEMWESILEGVNVSCDTRDCWNRQQHSTNYFNHFGAWCLVLEHLLGNTENM